MSAKNYVIAHQVTCKICGQFHIISNEIYQSLKDNEELVVPCPFVGMNMRSNYTKSEIKIWEGDHIDYAGKQIPNIFLRVIPK